MGFELQSLLASTTCPMMILANQSKHSKAHLYASRFDTRISFAFSRKDSNLQTITMAPYPALGREHIDKAAYPEGNAAHDNDINTAGHVG